MVGAVPHILRRGIAEPGRAGQADRRIGRRGIGDGQPGQRRRQRRPQRAGSGALGSGHQRRRQEHDAEIGVAADRGVRRRDGIADALADRLARRRQCRRRGERARLELRHGHAVALAQHMHIAGLQRAKLEAAGLDIGALQGLVAGHGVLRQCG